MKNLIKPLYAGLIAALCIQTSLAQLSESFYGSRYNIALMHSRIKADNGIKTGNNSFTSFHMFDFSFSDPKLWKSHWEFTSRVVSDAWWMIGQEIKGKTDYLSDGYLGSPLEMRWGINAFQKKQLLLTPGLASNMSWYVFAGHREFAWCIGPMLKADYQLSKSMMVRGYAGIDLPFTRSSGSLGGKSIYQYLRGEFITAKGFLIAVDYSGGKLSNSSNSLLPPSKINRLDFRIGYKIKM